jgi:hypothetical protein
MASADVATAKARAAKAINLIISSLPVSMHGFVATNKKLRDNRGLLRPVYSEGPLVEWKTVLGLMRARAALFRGCAVNPQPSIAKILRTSEMAHASLEVWLYH